MDELDYIELQMAMEDAYRKASEDAKRQQDATVAAATVLVTVAVAAGVAYATGPGKRQALKLRHKLANWIRPKENPVPMWTDEEKQAATEVAAAVKEILAKPDSKKS